MTDSVYPHSLFPRSGLGLDRASLGLGDHRIIGLERIIRSSDRRKVAVRAIFLTKERLNTYIEIYRQRL